MENLRIDKGLEEWNSAVSLPVMKAQWKRWITHTAGQILLPPPCVVTLRVAKAALAPGKLSSLQTSPPPTPSPYSRVFISPLSLPQRSNISSHETPCCVEWLWCMLSIKVLSFCLCYSPLFTSLLFISPYSLFSFSFLC